MKSEIRAEARAAKEKLGVNWANVIFIIVAHIAAVAALFFWSWPAVITGFVLFLRGRKFWHRHGISPVTYPSRL